ncbi:NACHT domain-containing protein [Lentzea sp. BCCO 10_0856]|uniref:NACHT domain-containing protein n=1 Tax=Lentzea miocenica TaxID=3095431 RepID=A0ABU4TAI8_9PSEU|nr:NACHT domain-containing protein [Lentzea sp. BCCO 10_0856]MDX8035173.1 NACHT domain-containing protein [Lentzea sp. BCCO 10_0856]
MTSPGRSRRDVLLSLARFAVVLVSLGVFVTLLTRSLQDNDSYASILSGIATIVTLFLALFDHLRRQDAVPLVDEAIEDLRMRLLTEWEPELRNRVQRSPHERTIPLEWRKYGGTGPSPLDGRFEGDPDEAAKQLARRFDQPAGKKRMVVLGEPGAGKTFIAIALAVGLLRHWSEAKPIAVYLSMSSWDPVVDSLDDWIIDTIANTYYSGAHHTPAKLLTARRLLPVLDGLDELPEHLRRLAVRRINDTLTGDRTLVVTCRTAEYEDVLTGGAPALLRAPAVEVLPVTPRDVLSRLKAVPAWADVVRHIEKRPIGPLATALSTPLMLSLFTATYLDRDPTELLDETKFGSRHSVEDHIVDMRLDTARPAQRSGSGWSPQQARKWLTFLAQHMHEHDERDITWRKLAYRAGSAATPLVVAVVLGGFLLLLTSAALPSKERFGLLISQRTTPVSLLTDKSPWTSVVLGAIGAATWLAFRRRPLPRARPDQARRRVRGFYRGMTVGFVAVLVPGFVLVLVATDANLYSAGGVIETSSLFCSTTALALVSGLGIGLHEMLVEHAAATRVAATARQDLRQERISTFLAATTAGLVIGSLAVLSTTITLEFGAHVGQRLARSMGLNTVTDLEMPPWGDGQAWVAVNYTEMFGASALVAILFALMLSATRAWPRLVMTRAKLVVGHRLPWSYRQFVSDATQLGLLRRSGSAHQFGHVLLQERLVATAARGGPAHGRPWPRIIGIGATALLLFTLVAGAAWSGRPAPCRVTGWAEVDARMTRAAIGQDSACFARIDLQDWERDLQRGLANAQVLADIKAQQSQAMDSIRSGYGAVSIVGEFDLMPPTEWHEVLVGIAAAQQVSRGTVSISFVYADLEGNDGPEAADLLDLFLQRAWQDSVLRGTRIYGYSAVALDVASSRVIGEGNTSTQVVSLNDEDFRARAREQGDRAALTWLNRPKTKAELVPPAEALVDDVEADLCTDLRAARRLGLSFDLRRAQLTSKLLNDMAECDGAAVLVKPEDVPALASLPNRPREVKINYVKDQSETVAGDCTRALGANPSVRSMKSCVAVVAANESFRVAVEQLPNPEVS